MKHKNGFTFIEVIVAVVLLGIIAAGFMAFSYSSANYYESNAAGYLAEKYIEEWRNNTYTGLITKINDTNVAKSGTYTVNGKVYNWALTATGYDVNSITNNQSYNLTGSKPVLSQNTNLSTAETIMLSVTVSRGLVSVTRTAVVTAP